MNTLRKAERPLHCSLDDTISFPRMEFNYKERKEDGKVVSPVAGRSREWMHVLFALSKCLHNRCLDEINTDTDPNFAYLLFLKARLDTRHIFHNFTRLLIMKYR